MNSLQKDYIRTFKEPLEFWTSEDGMLIALAVLPDAVEALKSHYVFVKEPFDKDRLKMRYARKEWVGMDYFDGNSGQRNGKVWHLYDDISEFPVLEYELLIPR